jgi:hypothetical protein
VTIQVTQKHHSAQIQQASRKKDLGRTVSRKKGKSTDLILGESRKEFRMR